MISPTERLATALADRYRIERELGQGGMATVYLAEDLKHKRKVALKVLKPELAAVLGADRFVQEITTTASLQHPHILPLFDSGTADGFLFYVMPFIEGETLRDKLNRETQLGVDEAVRIAREVADALDYAHGKGVIHRDIKPENILIQSGRPMVADFGIALAVSAAAGGRMTETGLSLGTPHYMSPEQATAEKEISARSDVYSLGSVLFEMLAGEPPHSGGSAQAIIMKIIAEPAQLVTKYRKSVPPNVAAAVAKSLEKVPADRFTSAKAFADALADAHFSAGHVAGPAIAGARSARPVVLALGLALGVVTLVAAWALSRPGPPPPTVHRYALAFPDVQLPDPFGVVAISDDGSRIFYLGRSPRSPGVTQFWYKSRDSLESVPLAGAEGASSIAVAPDGQTVAVIERNIVRKLSIMGGASTVVAQDASGISQSVAWLDDNSLVYVAQDQKRLKRVPSSGGTASVVWTADSLVLSTLTPLPGARGVFFQACRAPCGDTNLWVLDLRSSSARELRQNARSGYYLPSGHLVYVEDDLAAHAVRFDLKSLQIRGESVPVLDSIAIDAGTSPYLAISASGTLVMRRGTTAARGEFDLTWVDRAGRESVVDTSFTFRVTQTAGNFGWALSPDGSRLAIGRNTPEGDDIWIKSLPRGAATRLTFGGDSDARPRWTSDGRAVTFVTTAGIFLRRADGAGSDSLIWNGLTDEAAFSPNGDWLVIRRGASSSSAGGRDIFGVRQTGSDTALTPIVVTPYDESAFAISPDGRWIAYHSDETGRPEVFVRQFPNTNGAREQISTDGGRAPLWSRDGRELFYLRADNTMMAVPVAPGAEWRRTEPRALFQLRSALAMLEPSYYTPWDVAPDGRFIFARSREGGRDLRAPLIVIENWMEEVKAKVPR